MLLSRRNSIHLMLAGAFCPLPALSLEPDARRISLIAAPTNLGLRPGPDGVVPGTWKMPDVLLGAGLARALNAVKVGVVRRIAYDEHPQPGTRIRNGNSIRRFSLALANQVLECVRAGEFPIVLGGDCSVLLGSLLGARWAGGRGLIHVDGHSDFFHPGNYDTAKRLGSVAGMDLALATGRGEPLLTQWPGLDGALVADADALQIGERNARGPDYVPAGYSDIAQTAIARISVHQLHTIGLEKTLERVRAHLATRSLSRVWLHVDLDVLDQAVLPAVDSPGTPGLTAAELRVLLRAMMSTHCVIGADFTIYDPDLDPHRRYPQMLVDCIAQGIDGT
jgi:arginase